jgi:peptide/nickel transport system ATP-binding protein
VINNPQHPYTKALLDAVPEPDPDLSKTRVPGGGLRSAEIPSLRNLPSGCTFHPRCPLYEEGTCEVTEPQLVAIEPTRQVACHVVAREGALDKASGHA